MTASVLFLLSFSLAFIGGRPDASQARAVGTPTPAPEAAVINVSLIPAVRAANVLRTLFPAARIRVEPHANAVVVVAPAAQLQQMRGVVQGIDVRNPTRATVEVIELHVLRPQILAVRVRALYPSAFVDVASKHSLLVRAAAADQNEIKALITSLDVAPPTTAPTSESEDSVQLAFANPRVVARALARQSPHVRVSVSGTNVILVGPADDVQKTKTLAQSIDAPPFGSKYTQIYRLHNVDASSVANLIKRSYASLKITVDADLNAISVYGTSADQQRINTAIAQLDATPNSTSGSPSAAAYTDSNVDVVQLDSAMPGQGGSPSTSAQDIATAVQQALQPMASDLHLTVPANTAEIIVSGSPMTIRLAKDLIARLDRPQPLVVLDTEVLEVDENAARNIGLQFPGASLSSVFQEMSPPTNPVTGQQGRLIRLQPLNRTALQFTAALNFLVTQGNARVLADPRVTTISGHTATIRAGDTINVLTQTGGGVGTPVTQQLQTFNTGVTLDITPQVGPSGNVTVALHPVVNSLAGLNNGVPEIATRDTQTVVQLADNDTLVIGGLIQETLQHQVSKLPILGDIPLVGRLFQNSDVQSERNELVIVVTPHILKAGSAPPAPSATFPIPTPAPLPTLAPGTTLPTRLEPVPVTAPIPTAIRIVATPVPTTLPSPMPTPTAFANTNVFVFGSPPPNTFAADTAAPQIYYVEFSPTLLKNGTAVQISAVTSSNVRRVEVGYPGYMSTLSQVAPSKWQASYTFNASGVLSAQQTLTLTLNAYNQSAAAATVQIPVSIVNQ